ncbi:MAG: chromate transporter [Tissierellia bacterium]|nr:chromate transporter [Tissierellia bacterium]
MILKLAWEFFKTGLFAIGGGLATLPFLKQMAFKTTWFTTSDLMDMIAVSESTPGPIGINMATFAGYKAFGLLGGLVATVSLVIPSLIIITLVAKFMENYAENPLVKKGFYTLRPATVGLIAGAMVDVFLSSFFLVNNSMSPVSITFSIKIVPLVIYGLILFSINKKPQIHPIVYIISSAILGVFLKL